MKNNKKGFSLPLAMGIVILITILSLTILEYIIPFSRDIKGVENSSRAYYLANSGLEEGLYHVNTRTNEIDDNSTPFLGNVSTAYNTTSFGNILPPPGEGNSNYDNDWNTISSGSPIQLSIGKNYITNWGGVEVLFRVPAVGGSNDLKGNFSVVNWQLSSTSDSLNAKNTNGGIITVDDINGLGTFSIETLLGTNLSSTDEDISDFYNTNCSVLSNDCTLKFSIINKLETDDLLNPILLPYLEWKIDFNNNTLPLRYTKIEGLGKSYGFKKDLDIKVATQTVNEAFDFTVFQ